MDFSASCGHVHSVISGSKEHFYFTYSDFILLHEIQRSFWEKVNQHRTQCYQCHHNNGRRAKATEMTQNECNQNA